MRLAYLFDVLVKPTTIASIVGLIGPIHRLACLQYLAVRAFLGAGPPEPPPFPFLQGTLAPF